VEKSIVIMGYLKLPSFVKAGNNNSLQMMKFNEAISSLPEMRPSFNLLCGMLDVFLPKQPICLL
jgi:hypothetical protein